MNFKQMIRIRRIRAASFGQLFGLLVLLSGFIASTGLRVEPGAEVALLGEQIIDYVEVQQTGFRDLAVASPREDAAYSFLKRMVVISFKAGGVSIQN